LPRSKSRVRIPFPAPTFARRDASELRLASQPLRGPSRPASRFRAPSPRGKAEVCKTSTPGSNPGGASIYQLRSAGPLEIPRLAARSRSLGHAGALRLATSFQRSLAMAAQLRSAGPLEIPRLAARSRSLGHAGALRLATSFQRSLAMAAQLRSAGPLEIPRLAARSRSLGQRWRVALRDFLPALACGRRRFLSRGPVTIFRLLPQRCFLRVWSNCRSSCATFVDQCGQSSVVVLFDAPSESEHIRLTNRVRTPEPSSRRETGSRCRETDADPLDHDRQSRARPRGR
jgi:hypothetical protein